MWCDAQFRAFDKKIKLDATRRGRIESAIMAFISFCKDDSELAAAADGEPFLQGSVSTRTAIKPMWDEEFDVDVVYPFHLSAFGADPHPTPKQIMDWFARRLKEGAFYEANLVQKDRCARINYAGDFHVDIIPSTRELSIHRPYAVPARDLGDWITNNPIGFADWVKERDTRGGGTDEDGDGYFVRAVRFMKRWRDYYFDPENAPSSLLLVTFLGNHDPFIKNYTPPLEAPLYPEYQHDAAYLYDMLRLTHGCLKEPNWKAFMNPSVSGEDLARGWEKEHLDNF